MSHARDHEARTSEIGDVDDFDVSTVDAARITAAHHATSTEELRTFLHMLGIHPSQAKEPRHLTGPQKLPDGSGGSYHHLINTQPRTLPRVQDSPLSTLARTRAHLPDPKGD